MNDLWIRFASLSQWGIGVPWSEPFIYVTIPLLLNLVLSAVWTKIRGTQNLKREHFFVFLPLLAYPAIAIVGAHAWMSGVPIGPLGRPNSNVIASWFVLTLNVLSMAFGIFMIVKMKGVRWLSVSVFFFIQWMLQGIDLMVSMPIGGVWM